MTQHIASPRKFLLTNWTLHVGGLPSPLTSSYKLLTVVHENEADKNVIVLKTTNSQTVVLQSHFQLIKLKGFCLVVYRSFKGHARHFFVQDASDWRTDWCELLTYE
jgi:hypothetical protein